MEFTQRQDIYFKYRGQKCI